MRRPFALVLAIVAVVPLLISATPATYPPATTSPVFTVTGAVANPLSLTAAQLRRFPARQVTVRFESGTGTQRHRYTGARLLDVLTRAEPAFDPAIKNHQLTFAVLVSATDGYRAAVAWAEFDPGFVPGDVKGGRYVSGVTEVRLAGLS